MNCKFCNSNLTTAYSANEYLSECKNHGNVLVHFRDRDKVDDSDARYIFIIGEYRGYFYFKRIAGHKFYLYKVDFFNPIKEIVHLDFLPNITPETFEEKIKTLMVFS